jgi:hypothetical protein
MTTIGIGTEKGAFILRASAGDWQVEGPVLPGWRVTTFGRTPSGEHLVATGSNWFGAAIHRSRDLATWDQLVDGPAWPEGGDRKLNHVWTISTVGDTLYAGVDDAGLFASDDGGGSWHPVDGFNEHPTRSKWFPGFGGLAAHCLVADPVDPERMWLGVSAVGVFRTGDGGASWTLHNEGVVPTAPDDDIPGIGFCVHRIVGDPGNPETLWRQDHRGVYRSTDGADTWQRIEEGLPSGFGFPMVRDDASGALFVVPLTSDEHRFPIDGRLAVYRSLDAGDTWHVSGRGFPADPVYAGVLRDAMDTDGDGGVYLGTTSGTVLVSSDAGDTWETIPGVLPRIHSVRVLEA